MDNLILPLISPLSRKYYQYASDDSERIHHRAEDVRICLEKICDSLVIQFVAPSIKSNWGNYKLHHKIEACKKFMDGKVVEGLLNAKCIGNKGVHEGEEGDFTQKDIDESLEAIKNFFS